jgi:hypothetical protein
MGGDRGCVRGPGRDRDDELDPELAEKLKDLEKRTVRHKHYDEIVMKDPYPAGTAVDGPAHYKGYDVLEIINRYDLGFELGNVMKYILRADAKGKALEDLKKAQFYLNWYIKNFEAEPR